MNPEKWEKNRIKGKKRFILLTGVLGWGVSTAIMWSVAMAFIEPVDELWVRPLIALVVFPLGGIAFGHFAWNSAEKEYARMKHSS